MTELARYQEGYAAVVVSREADDLVFDEEFDDGGRMISSRSRLPVADFIAGGPGPWPWFDLGQRHAGTLLVLGALGVEPPAWTVPLEPAVLDLFTRARNGSSSLPELLATGIEPDPLDPTGATPLWYAVRSLSLDAPVALIDAGADATRRVPLSARGERWTTVLHGIVELGRTLALAHALDRGATTALLDSDGATPLHVLGADSDHVSPELVRRLVAAGAPVGAPTPGGTVPVEVASRLLLPDTVTALLDLGADPARGLDAVLTWWSVNATFFGYRAARVVAVVEVLRAGGAEVSDVHRERAAEAGVAVVQTALT